MDLDRAYAQRCSHVARSLDSFERRGREVQRQQLALSSHGERTAQRHELQAIGVGSDVPEVDERGGERGVTTEPDLTGRREPTDAEAVSLRGEERCLGQVVLAGDGLRPRSENAALMRSATAAPEGLCSRSYPSPNRVGVPCTDPLAFPIPETGLFYNRHRYYDPDLGLQPAGRRKRRPPAASATA